MNLIQIIYSDYHEYIVYGLLLNLTAFIFRFVYHISNFDHITTTLINKKIEKNRLTPKFFLAQSIFAAPMPFLLFIGISIYFFQIGSYFSNNPKKKFIDFLLEKRFRQY